MSNVRVFDVSIATMVGVEAATLYQQINYWYNKKKKNLSFIYKLDEDWLKELPFFQSVYAIRRAKKKLIDSGLIKVFYKLINNKRTTCISLDVEESVIEEHKKEDVQDVGDNTRLNEHSEACSNDLQEDGTTLPEILETSINTLKSCDNETKTLYLSTKEKNCLLATLKDKKHIEYESDNLSISGEWCIVANKEFIISSYVGYGSAYMKDVCCKTREKMLLNKLNVINVDNT